MLVTFATFVILLIWASFSELDKITHGDGKVVPSQQTQVIQSYEGGIIKRILVKEGDVVNKDQPLVEIDQSTLVSQYKQAQQQYFAAFAKAVRLTAEINGTVPVYTDQLHKDAPAIVMAQSELYKGRQIQLASELSGLQNQLVQRQQELLEIGVTLDTTEKSISYYDAEMKMIAPLIEKGLEPQITLVQQQRALSELQGKLAIAREAKIRLTAAVDEVKEKVQSAKNKFRADALADLTTVTGQISEIEQTLPALKDRVERTEIRSPIHGVVNRIFANTIGGVAQSAAGLMEIVPVEDTLLIEAHVEPKDIAFIHLGQHALVKISAYDYSRYGGFDGKVTNISADAVRISKDDSRTAFIVQVSTDKNYLNAGEEKLYITPGMIADVNIVIGKRTILSYLFAPVLRLKENALHE